MEHDELLDRRQVSLSDEGRAALLAALRAHFPRYPSGVYPARLKELITVDQRTLAKMLEPGSRVRQASVDAIFKDLGAPFVEDEHLDLRAGAVSPREPSVPAEAIAVKSAPAGRAGDAEPLPPASSAGPPSPPGPSIAEPRAERPRASARPLAAVVLALVCVVAACVAVMFHAKRPHVAAASNGSAPPGRAARPAQVAVAASGAVVPPPGSRRQQNQVLLYDNFAADTALDSSQWTIDGPAARAALAEFSGPRVAIVTPRFSFDSENGLGIAGVDGAGQRGGIQSRQSISPPFTVTALCSAVSIQGDALRLAIANADAGEGVSLAFAGPAAGGGDQGGFLCAESRGAGKPWQQVGGALSPLPPAGDVWYVLAISVDSSGEAAVEVSSGGFTIGKMRARAGMGPFYLILSQGTGAQQAPGPNRAYCGVIQVISKAEE